jgi:hypothetical protein
VQGLQLDESAAAHVPAAQSVGCTTPTAQKEPAGQGACCVPAVVVELQK